MLHFIKKWFCVRKNLLHTIKSTCYSRTDGFIHFIYFETCSADAATIKTNLVHNHEVFSSEFLCLNHIACACKRRRLINSISAHSSESDVVRLCIRFQCIKVPCVKHDGLMSLKARRHWRSALALKPDGLVY